MDKQSRKREFKQLRPLLDAIAAGIAGQFGPNCEVVVHDITDGLEKTVAIIYNGQVSGRKIGDGASETVLEALRNNDIRDRYGYFTNTRDGRMLKSTTINIRGTDGTVLAAICINFDISDLALAARSLNEFLAAEEPPTPLGAEAISSNVNELLDQLIEESHRYIGKPIAAMTRQDKTEAIRYLDRKGALLIKKSSERIARYYGISKYTLYNYLGETAKEKEAPTPAFGHGPNDG
ncbi:MAG: helix-turn-helix transcriptional regulator [Coriobacteriales bacterium]|jgi:predicted transcriptional regulator YheO|nr:helix-turn-helix transcriptional regulator [Coriobacteriales bacterium]